jgi:Calx-beta domain
MLRVVAAVVAMATLGTAEAASAVVIERAPVRVAEGAQALLHVYPEDGDRGHIRLIPVAGSATAGEDFDPTPVEVGDAEAYRGGGTQVWVDTVWDDVDEADETFTVRTEDGTASATVTIQDRDDSLASIGILGPQDVRESSAQSLTFELARPAEHDVTVRYRTVDASARAGEDYAPLSGTLTFPAGATTASVVLDVAGDDVYEGAEQLYVVLTGEGVYDAAQRVVIDDIDDYPRMSIDEGRIRETDGPGFVRFRVRLTNAVKHPPVLVLKASGSGAPGSATPGADFTESPVQVVFAPGAREAFVDFPIAGDDVQEPTERFFVYPHWVRGINVGPGAGWGVGVIEDDDTAVPIGVEAPELLDLRTVGVTLSCPPRVRTCVGRVALSFRGRARAAAAARRFRLRGGASRTVRMALPASARRALARGRAVPVRAGVVLRGRGRTGSSAVLRAPR